MKIVHQKLDYSADWALPNIYLFTGNPVRKNNGAIVMGRGAAKQVRDTYPGLDLLYGNKLADKPDAHLIWLFIGANPDKVLGWFKVKHHWQDPADLELIQQSTKQLKQIAEHVPHYVFHINFPGVGNGKLTEEDVLPILETLPDNVRIYR